MDFNWYKLKVIIKGSIKILILEIELFFEKKYVYFEVYLIL